MTKCMTEPAAITIARFHAGTAGRTPAARRRVDRPREVIPTILHEAAGGIALTPYSVSPRGATTAWGRSRRRTR